MHRYTYANMIERAGRLANALDHVDISPDGWVATFVWNNYRHLDIYFGTSDRAACCIR
jgi:fatty-acyl-CoA synthase